MTRKECIERLAAAIAHLYDRREALQIARMTVCHLEGVSLSQLLADPGAEARIEGFDPTVEELRQGRPVQYVLGHTEFCGLKIAVREGVLIPRPETEELVAWAAAELPADARILDAGTGSGCIALALKERLPRARITGIDLSEEALEIARENARTLRLEVDFRRADILGGMEAVEGSFDAVISNPPYVPASDRRTMHPNVVGYEPARALFVPDDDPLLFYRAVARAGMRLLAPGGGLWFEIYEKSAEALSRLLAGEGFPATEVRCDLNGKPRMIWSRR